MKIIAIIPIKHHSSRVSGKNYRMMNNKPLFHYILETVSKSRHITDIIVDTNSPIIKEGINKYFPHIKIYNRPDKLCPPNTSTNTLLINVIENLNLDADIYFQTHTTNPLLKVNTIDSAIDQFVNSDHQYDSMFSVKTHHTRLYDKNGKDMNHNRHILIPTQDLDPIYEENSCMYLFTKKSLLTYNSRIGIDPLLYKMADIESQDIDWEDDFLITEQIMKMDGINNKIILVTGALGGIGSAICKLFHKEGWYIIGTDILDIYVPEYIDRYIKCDLTDQDDLTNLINSIYQNENKLNCLVNNAGYQVIGSLVDLKLSDWDKVMDCNLKAPMILSKKLIHLLAKNINSSIINIASVHQKCTSPNIGAYACSKAGLVGLTKNMAIEFGSSYKVRVNSISPGAIDTPMLRDGLTRNKNSDIEDMGKKHLLGSVGSGEDIARTAKYLAECEFITGTDICVDGGVSIQLSSE